MLLATIVILFSLLALGLLALLDRFDGAPLKAHTARHQEDGSKIQYYDAFSEHRESQQSPAPTGRASQTKRNAAA